MTDTIKIVVPTLVILAINISNNNNHTSFSQLFTP
ncbi:MAG: hypothetical protein RL344_978 [Pseudomonadota bacterium]|jgi:hypothetical protein